ncbi:AAA family ATPase [Parvularcula dongshanensis]|uniref:MoxR-like ATPase n=1 Tax=Parvularcula dongshanensis TaxID=1173995 RepID=A0A840HYD6_9PROT|nr:MoxR family ATPase [Parvularcula dongshanensis]MBB4657866.1 MoxR-like ATPase [Parvularcula dongshanensis]
MATVREDPMDRFDRLAALTTRAREALETYVFGQERVIEEVLISLLAGGHGLLVGTPGLAKTRLVAGTATVLGLSERRVQFTPDLMPSDILGTEILEETEGGHRAFRFVEGPVFCQLLMADEINRASPRTQSALLEAMQERQVTVAGERRVLPQPFHVLATQNPIEQEGTYPLPEAQLDRFLLQIDVDYPSLEAERRMLAATTGGAETPLSAVMGAKDLEDAQALVRDLPIGERVVDAILGLVRDARPGGASAEGLSWGPGPRASQALSLAVRARALLQGRTAPEVSDVIALAGPALRHRIALTFAARAEGRTVSGVIGEMTARL